MRPFAAENLACRGLSSALEINLLAQQQPYTVGGRVIIEEPCELVPGQDTAIRASGIFGSNSSIGLPAGSSIST